MNNLLNNLDTSEMNFTTYTYGSTIGSEFFLGINERNSTKWSGITTDDQFYRRLLIGKTSNICNGEPVIIGSRISVVNIIETSKLLGWDEARLQHEFPHLSLDEIRACFEYYEDYKSEIDSLIDPEDV